MPRPVLLAGAILLTLAAPAFAAATADSGAELAAQCRAAAAAGPETPDAVKCVAYLVGLFDGLRVMSMNTRDPLICPPQSLQDRSFADAYLRWAQYNPHRLDLYPSGGAIEALLQAFPCRR